MSRRLRIRIVAGLVGMMLGVATASFGGLLVMALWMPDVSPTNLENNLAQVTSQMADVGNVVMYTQFGGWGLAGLSFLYTFLLWASWFIGPREESLS